MILRRISKALITIFLFTIFFSCAHINQGSGFYVQVQKYDSLSKICKRYDVSKTEMKYLNPSSQFGVGEWVFVPHPKGLLDILYYKKRDQRIFESEVAYFSEGNVKKFMWPVPSSKRISSHYGYRVGRKHQGVDIPAERGTSIVSIADGKVIYSGRGISGYGNLTIIDHGKGYHSVYAHADRNYTEKGDKVYKAQVIAKIGSTGRSTGPHLHFEIRYRNYPRNPMAYFPKHPMYKNYNQRFARK
jgi:murein DD-endopeptidase MepM/ murein hydrolase activator NlpD